MNRRAFLLGCISAPISVKVDAVSAALRPGLSGYATRPAGIITLSQYSKTIVCEKQALLDMLLKANELFASIPFANATPLDRPAAPWHDGKAGRDQIG